MVKKNSLVQNINLLKNLPRNWKVFPFSKIIKDVSGGNLKTKKGDFLDYGKIKVVDQGKDLFAGFVSDEKLLVKSNLPYIVFGDHTRIIKYIDFPFAMGADGTKILKIKPNIDSFEKYIYYFFQTLNIPNTGYNRHFKYLKDCQIPLPKLETQKKIAAILDEADKIRQLNKQLIAKYDALTQSLFLDMFGNPFDGENIESLKDNIKIISGYAFKSKDFVENGIPLIKIGTVNKGYFETDNFSYLPKEFLEKYSKWIVRPNDILMSLTGTVGKNDYGNVEVSDSTFLEYFLNQRVARLEPSNDKYLKGFLLGLFSNLKTKTILTKISRGVRQANISNRDIENLKMIIPSLKMQKKYIDSIELVKNQKQQAQKSLQKSEDLFNSLLQKAFKGTLVKE